MYNARTPSRFIVTLVTAVTILGVGYTPLYATTADGSLHGDPSATAREIRVWRELKYGMFIHYGLITYADNESTIGTAPAEDFNPTDLDVEQWVRVAKDAGMKYVVLTAKHVGGFCLWDSKVKWKGEEFTHDIANSPVNTDVVAAFLEASKKHGIVPGIYYNAMDLRHSLREIDWTPELPCLSEEYFQLMKDHLTELHTLYPDIAIQWIDIPRHLTFEQRDTLYKIVKGLNPDCLVMYNYGNESRDLAGDYSIEEAMKVTWPTDILNSENTPIKQPFREQQEYMGKKYELGYEHCRSLVNGWFWSETLEPRPVAELTALWDEIGELNGNLLLNVPPDKTGQIPEAYIRLLDKLRKHMEK